MPTLRFAEFQTGAVAEGRKRRTIRAPRKTEIKPGDALRLTGPRPKARLLREAVCAYTVPVTLTIGDGGTSILAAVAGAPVADIEAFAAADGFQDADAMARFFHGLYGPGEFRGIMICW